MKYKKMDEERTNSQSEKKLNEGEIKNEYSVRNEKRRI